MRGYLGQSEVVLNRLAGKWTVLKRSDGKYVDLTAETGLRVEESSIAITRTALIEMEAPKLVGLTKSFILDDNFGAIICNRCQTEDEGWFGHLLY